MNTLNTKNKMYTYTIAILMILLGFQSCEREENILEPAPFPTDSEVFIDGFGPSIEPHSFLGTKLDALQTDDEEVYSGTQSIKITIPGPGDPSGSTWSGGALVAGLARDLSGYNALTFWAKASKADTMNTVGIGNDNEAPNLYVAERVNLPLTTSWTQYIIPIPDSEKLQQEQGMFYYSEGQENGEGAFIWLDEMQFEYLGTIAHPSVSFAERDIDVYQNSTITVPGITVTTNVDGTNVDVIASQHYLNFSSSDTTIVAIDSDGSMNAVGLGSATIYATLGDEVINDSLNITVGEAPPAPENTAPVPTIPADSVVSIFSAAYTDVTTPNWYTYWEGTTTEVDEFVLNDDVMMRFLKLNWAGIDFPDLVNASGMTHFHMDVWTPDATASATSFKVLLVDFGADGAHGGGDDSSHEISLSSTTSPAIITDEWSQLDIPFSALSGLTSTNHLGQLVISGDVNTIYIDNVYFFDDGEGTIEPPPSGDGPAEAAPTPTADPDSVVSIFSDAYTDVTIPDWYTYWEGTTTQVEKIGIGSDSLIQFTVLNWAGVDFPELADASAMNYFHIDVWTPDETSSATSFNVKLVDFGSDGVVGTGDDSEHEVSFSSSSSPAIISNEWSQLDVPLSSFTGLSATSNIGQLVVSGAISTVYVDNVYFYVESEGGGETPASGPSTPAATPTADPDSVISFFSNAYTNVTVDSWATGWEWSTAVVEDVQVDGDDIMLYTGLNFNGIEFSTEVVDVSEMNHFHMDIWTPDPTSSPASFNIKLIDFGADGAYDGGDDSEHELSFTASSSPALTTGSWVNIDVAMSAFSGLTSQAHLAQMVISATEGLDSVYVDNVYFYVESEGGGETPSEPESAATTPTHAASDVISLFSGAYTNVTVDTWSADWDNADLADVQVAGDDVKLYTNLSFCGIEFTSQTIDASSMTHFSFDMWTPDETTAPLAFKVKLVDFGADGAYSGGDDVEYELTYTATSSPALATGSWVTFDIPLSDFTGLTSTGHMAQLIYSGDLSTIYLDNILFHK